MSTFAGRTGGASVAELKTQIEGLIPDSLVDDAGPSDAGRSDVEHEAPADTPEPPRSRRRNRQEPPEPPAEVQDDAPEHDEPEAPNEPDTDPDEGDGEALEISTLEDFAKASGWSVEDLLDLKHSYKVGDETKESTLRAWKDGAYEQASYTRKFQELADQRRQLEAQEQQRNQAFQQAHQQVADRFNELGQLIQQAYHDPELEVLRDTDPGAYAARKQDLTARWQQLQAQKQTAAVQYQQQMQQMQHQRLQQEQQLLRELAPNWGAAEERAVGDLVKQMGFRQQDIQAVSWSAPLMHALHELATLRQAAAKNTQRQAAAKKVVQQVKRRVPKIQPPTSSRTRNGRAAQTEKARAAKAVRQQARKTGTVKDNARVIESMLPEDF